MAKGARLRKIVKGRIPEEKGVGFLCILEWAAASPKVEGSGDVASLPCEAKAWPSAAALLLLLLLLMMVMMMMILLLICFC